VLSPGLQVFFDLISLSLFQTTNLLSRYLMLNKDRLFDLRNIQICFVENDPLGVAFGVKAFARSQVT